MSIYIGETKERIKQAMRLARKEERGHGLVLFSFISKGTKVGRKGCFVGFVGRAYVLTSIALVLVCGGGGLIEWKGRGGQRGKKGDTHAKPRKSPIPNQTKATHTKPPARTNGDVTIYPRLSASPRIFLGEPTRPKRSVLGLLSLMVGLPSLILIPFPPLSCERTAQGHKAENT